MKEQKEQQPEDRKKTIVLQRRYVYFGFYCEFYCFSNYRVTKVFFCSFILFSYFILLLNSYIYILHIRIRISICIFYLLQFDVILYDFAFYHCSNSTIHNPQSTFHTQKNILFFSMNVHKLFHKNDC